MSTFAPMSSHLETERLSLGPWAESDADEVCSLHAERVNGTPTVEHAQAIIADQLAATARTGIALLAIGRRDEGDFIGYCGLIVGRSTLEEPEIAYELFQRVHGWLRNRGGLGGARRCDSDRAHKALVDCPYVEHAIVPCP